MLASPLAHLLTRVNRSARGSRRPWLLDAPRSHPKLLEPLDEPPGIHHEAIAREMNRGRTGPDTAAATLTAIIVRAISSG
jgi:hypothetical protein